MKGGSDISLPHAILWQASFSFPLPWDFLLLLGRFSQPPQRTHITRTNTREVRYK